MTARHNYIIIATFEGLKQPLGLKVETATRAETAIIIIVFKIVIMSGQQPACRTMIIICLINKVGYQFNTL